ncbi:ORC ubiquitin ligase 1 [Eleutherodactylus coqui]|uniref:RING-type domain-containing protein n=1 Tax=Eleutherodactylus coqui TaxID=57060 RepID=A0A8J6KHV7_ELECQ|nr:hypothetical protein GDO78_000579 [Eleutherodactylus coqui]
MAHSVQNVTLALTLPITCHICLGKVRQPVICANNHVFCSVCIELWLKNNSQCPACRVPITKENPCKNIIGGTSEDEGTLSHSGRMHLRKTRLQLLQKEYEEEIESLLEEKEELKRANLQLEERLSEATDPVAVSISCNCENKEARRSRDISDRLLEEWSRKLEMVKTANKNVVEDNEKLKEENQKLRNENAEFVRENLRLKNEVDLRSPQKFGRFTVAALQAKVDQYEREMSRLKKALERSDQYIEELEAQVEQLERPPEDIQKEKSQCGNAAHVHVTDATTAYTCQELKTTQQFSSHSHKKGVHTEEPSGTYSKSNRHSPGLKQLKSVSQNKGSPELKSKFSTLLNSDEQMSIDRKSQREGAEVAQVFGSPTLSLPFSTLQLNTPGSKANCSSSGHLKKPLTYLRKLVFDDLPKRKELSKSKSISENHLNTGEGLMCFREPKPSFYQINCESADDGSPGHYEDIDLQVGKQKDNATDQRKHPKSLNKSRISVENVVDEGCHDDISEHSAVMCNGRSQGSCYGSISSTLGSKMSFWRDSTVKACKGLGDAVSSHQDEEPIDFVSFASCSSSAVGDVKDSKYYMNQSAGVIQDKNFQGHLPHTDTVLCEPSLQTKQELIFHSVSGEARHTEHASQSTCLSHCIAKSYSNSPPAKRKMLNQPSDSPSKP